jgi:hypothetical protein
MVKNIHRRRVKTFISSCSYFIEDTTKSPNITFFWVSHSFPNFWGTITWSTSKIEINRAVISSNWGYLKLWSLITPKSPIQTSYSLVRKMFFGLRSLWSTLRAWKLSNPRAISIRNFHNLISETAMPFWIFINASRSPLSQYSITILRVPSSMNES